MPHFTTFPRALFACLFALCLTSPLFFLASVEAAPTAVEIVSPDDLNEWALLQENPVAPGNGQFVAGPAPAPAGAGSLRLNPANSTVGESIVSGMPTTRFSDVTTLTYHTYRATGSNAQAIALQFAVCRSYIGSFCWGRSRLVYEPYWTGTNPSTAVWQEWNALAPEARWWMTNINVNNTCGRDNPCTVAQLLTTYPNLDILNETSGIGVLLKAGSGWANFDGYVDNLTIGLNGVETTYDFEPGQPVHNITQNSHHPTIQEGVDNATAGDIIEIDPGIYIENVVVDKALTLRGSGEGDDPTVDTILDGTTLTGMGIRLANSVTDVTIEALRIVNYGGVNPSAGIYGNGQNNRLTIQNVTVNGNGPGFVSASGGIVLNGPVDTVLIDNVTAHDNTGRGIVIWNGHKSNITITNNDVQNNDCCGIELQDGTASGVTMTHNNVVDNGDSGMSAMGLMAGDGPNLIAHNTVSNNGRFGIEIKNPDGNELDSGDGSIVVEYNTVSLAASPTMNVRDHAGIAVFRRDVQVGNVDVPHGVVVRHNNVSGYQHQNGARVESAGFGIVIEGRHHTVTANTLASNNVGIQVQGGMHPNANYPANAEQGDGMSSGYFGRGNAPIACGNHIFGNIFVPSVPDPDVIGILSNDEEFVRVVPPEAERVLNVQTTQTFCTIQQAIDNLDTVAGHTVMVTAGSFAEQVLIDKPILLRGPNSAAFGGGVRVAEAVIDGGSNTAVTIASDNVTLEGFRIIGQDGLVVQPNHTNLTLQNNLIEVDGVGVALSTGAELLLRGNQLVADSLFALAVDSGLVAYANHLLAGSTAGLPGAAASLNARHNWWGSYETQPTAVDSDSWAFRLGAAVTSWTVGTGSATLADSLAGDNATLTGNGTLVIVNHGSGLGNAPFGKGIPDDTGVNQCADFYDFFVLGGSGSYQVAIPVASTCTDTLIESKLFRFALEGSGAPATGCAPDTACWVRLPASRTGDLLTVTVPLNEVLGTPFAAPSVNNNNPTAVVLSSWQVAPSMMGVPLWVWFWVILLGGATAVVWRRRASYKLS